MKTHINLLELHDCVGVKEIRFYAFTSILPLCARNSSARSFEKHTWVCAFSAARCSLPVRERNCDGLRQIRH